MLRTKRTIYNQNRIPEREISIHTKISFWLGFVAILFEMYLGITYIWSSDSTDRLFGQLTMLEGVFALVGLYAIDLINRKKFRIIPKEYSKLDSNTFIRGSILVLSLFLIQFVFQYVPLTVRTWQKAGAIIFAAPAEELFFRGLMIQIFIYVSSIFPVASITLRKKSKGKEARELSVVEGFGILFSAVLFSFLHVNYYGDIRILISVFVSGLFLGFFYWWFRDITANILAHFILNFITVIQIFGMVYF